MLLKSKNYKDIDQRYNLNDDENCFVYFNLYESIFKRKTTFYKIQA